MKDISRLKPEEFETLLGWLSADREQGGTEYLQIRAGLIRFFRFKGCSDAQSLADEVLNRVAAKIPGFDESKIVKRMTIFYGFASNIFLEYLRNEKKQNERLNEHLASQNNFAAFDEDANEPRLECLNECLGKLSVEEKEIFTEYYASEKEKKSEARKKLAARINCELNTLQVRIFRLRGILAKCIENCLKKSL
jgi:DNA-directed RNA polymerase specialized sigma24 family protein